MQCLKYIKIKQRLFPERKNTEMKDQNMKVLGAKIWDYSRINTKEEKI